MRNLVVLISGRGSNLEALVETARRDQWDAVLDARIAAVICSRPDAAGLAVARRSNIPTRVIDDRGFASRAAFDAALLGAVTSYDPVLVVLAGFMRVLAPDFVDRLAGRLINVHPSLLPAFTGQATHRRALAAGVRIHGATVHFVTGEVDAGPIIAQAAVAVQPDDDEDSLAARVLQREHALLPLCVRWLLEGSAWLENGRVVASADLVPALAALAP